MAKHKQFEYEVLKLGEDEVANASLKQQLNALGAEGWEYCDDLSIRASSIIVLMREKE